MRGSVRALAGLVLAGAALTSPNLAAAAPEARHTDRDAAYLQEAFSHDLCARDDRGLRKLSRALARKTAAGPR